MLIAVTARFPFAEKPETSEAKPSGENQNDIGFDARLTEYHPDAPPDKQRQEGGNE